MPEPKQPSRRAMLAGIPAAAMATAVLPAAALASAANDPIFAAIERHRAAEAAFEKVCPLTDRVAAEQEGRVVTDGDHEAYEVANDAECDAIDELLTTVPQTTAGVRAFLRYLRVIWRDLDDGADTVFDTLAMSPALAGGFHV